MNSGVTWNWYRMMVLDECLKENQRLNQNPQTPFALNILIRDLSMLAVQAFWSGEENEFCVERKDTNSCRAYELNYLSLSMAPYPSSRRWLKTIHAPHECIDASAVAMGDSTGVLSGSSLMDHVMTRLFPYGQTFFWWLAIWCSSDYCTCWLNYFTFEQDVPFCSRTGFWWHVGGIIWIVKKPSYWPYVCDVLQTFHFDRTYSLTASTWGGPQRIYNRYELVWDYFLKTSFPEEKLSRLKGFEVRYFGITLGF
jgi:hypothetical protein